MIFLVYKLGLRLLCNKKTHDVATRGARVMSIYCGIMIADVEHEYVGHSLEEAGAGIEVGEAIRFHVAKVVHFLYKANNIWLKMI